MAPKLTGPRIDPSLKAERIQLPAPPADLDLELATPAEAEDLAAWLSGVVCPAEGGAVVIVDGRRLTVAAAA